MAAKTEAVAHGNRDFSVARFVGDEIQIAPFIGIVQVDRRRDEIALDRQSRDDGFNAAAGAQEMAQFALGLTDGDALGVVAEGGLDCLGLGEISQRCAGAVGVDVIDVIGAERGIAQRQLHRPTRAAALFIGGGDVIGIAAHAVTDQFAIDACAAGLGVFVFFEDHHAGAFAHDKTVAGLIPWPARSLWIIVARRERAGGTETSHAQFAQSRFRTTGDHHIRLIVLDISPGITDGVGPGSARRRDGGVWTVDAEEDRHVSAGGVHHQARHGERADPAHTARDEDLVLLFKRLDATDSAADDHTTAIAIGFVEIEAGIVDGTNGRRDAKLAESVEPLGLERVGGEFRDIVLLEIEVGAFTAKAGRRWDPIG